ncbi:Ribosomal protein L11 methyltransferase [Fundidesulfovibrio magnetotacticus]|uniref:Ribosomal protein L11 methyltransferase n=1 Tax=Fundidesulfovibrio magnetotacticus TaxID=2730080 RepID=A0A6V8LSG9_9BACT|nr:50S ribosomal protein L11 methyltransferase [Fundidesulfovibrio magnetotacticus]GFK92736.1 Ribosomal protein L11 methyltransferase [Fundidesulfovibrio magnetotacticus]
MPETAAKAPQTAPCQPDYTRGERQCLHVEELGRTWKLHRTADMETLWENLGREEFGEDERMPYWAELWPASMLLCRWLGRNRELVRGKACLDIGCGLGLTGIVGAWLGARVVGMDHQWPAVYFSRENARLNGVDGPLWTRMDWCAPAFKPRAFDVMWGGDIVYETRFYHPLTRLFRDHLAPGGRIWLAEPRRSVSRPVWERLAGDGFAVRKLLTEPVPVEGYEVTVNLWELSLPE